MLRRIVFKKKLIYSLSLTCTIFLLVNIYLLNIQEKNFERVLGHDKKSSQYFWKGFDFHTSQTTKINLSEFNITEIENNLVQQVSWCSKCNALEGQWNITHMWITSRQIHGENTLLGQMLKRMSTAKITRVTVHKGGTQLKLLLHLEGGQKALFKPQRFSRDHVITGEPYAGADRHNGEIAAFHLNRLLNFRRSPLVVGRKIHLNQEVFPVAEARLQNTFTTQNNKTCFYGVCHYCTASDPVCSDENGILEGSVILWLPPFMKLKAFRHPWSRTYREGIKAPWETHKDFCRSVRKTPPYDTGTRLLDLIDTAIFDFLIGNADRHRYEVFEGIEESIVLLLDNGKSFGNPFHNEISILAPLYQCCILRKSTWERINLFEKDALGTTLKQLMSSDPIEPILTDYHLEALNQRLSIIKDTVNECFHENKKNNVIIDR